MRTYDFELYGRMMVDPGRQHAYAEALRRTVRPGSVVLDIGTGLGAHALLAARLGAQVVAVEPDDVIELARTFARRNGLEDRVQLIQGVSQDLQLERPADVIVTDLRGSLPFYGRNANAVADARDRLLAPGGVLLPARDTLQAAVVSAADRWQALHTPWAADVDGVDFSHGLSFATSNWVGFADHQPTQESLLSRPGSWGEIDYRTVTSGSHDGNVELVVTRGGTAHGLCLWFDAEVLDDLGFSNAPGGGSVYGQVFAPWPEPVVVQEGTTVSVRLRARLVGVGHLLEWETTIAGGAGASFSQSNFGAVPLPRQKLVRRKRTYTPQATEDARVARTVLEAFDGRHDLQQIAEVLVAEFPSRFPDVEDALHEVRGLVEHYGA